MEKQSKKKITWTIKNFSSLRGSEMIRSEAFFVGGCKWRLCAHPKRYNTDYVLEVADSESLPLGWRRHVRYLLSLVHQNSLIYSKQNETENWFDDMRPLWGFRFMLTLSEIQAKDSGFVVNGELKIVAEVEVLEVIGKLHVSDVTSTIMETMDVNGFQLLPSQVEYVSRLFERHPEFASDFRANNANIRTSYISLLLSLIETLCQSSHKLLNADLDEAYVALSFLTDAGFKLDWLEKKLGEMFQKIEKEEILVTRKQEIEEELKDLKHKCSDLEAELEKNKADVAAAIAPISFDDVIQ